VPGITHPLSRSRCRLWAAGRPAARPASAAVLM